MKNYKIEKESKFLEIMNYRYLNLSIKKDYFGIEFWEYVLYQMTVLANKILLNKYHVVSRSCITSLLNETYSCKDRARTSHLKNLLKTSDNKYFIFSLKENGEIDHEILRIKHISFESVFNLLEIRTKLK